VYGGKYYALMAGDPGLFGSLKKIAGGIGKVLRSPVGQVASIVVPGGLALKGLGIAGRVAGVARRVLPGIGKVGAGAAVGAGVSRALVPVGTRAVAPYVPGFAGSAAGAGSGLGRFALGGAAGAAAAAALQGGPGVRRYRRINPLNPKAARRAIRRIKAVRKMVRSIESQLPKRACSRSGSFGYRRRRRAA
jgi:hypothetical protein